MKFAFLLLLLAVISGCTNSNKHSIKPELQKDSEVSMVSFKLNTITVYKENDGYVTTISNGHAVRTVAFTKNREATSVDNIELIEPNSFERYVAKKYDEVVAELGEPHTDIGSGFYIPTYLTSDARLVSFYIENESVSDIWIRDLFSGEVICKTGDGLREPF